MNTETICAIASPHGIGGVAVIRLSGKDSIAIASKVFRPHKKGLKVEDIHSHKVVLGWFGKHDGVLDEVLCTFFKSPHSYTGEDVIEFSCHGSLYIQENILFALIQSGARLAKPGEFTMRAFLNGKMDLSQAESVADLISSNSETSHQLAIQNLRGGISLKIQNFRNRLLHFASLIELELDFSEEDVEFANREQFHALLSEMQYEVDLLVGSFAQGNAMKKGIPVAIIGKPNVGKSTLLNTLLKEEKAIVSDIAGTTRDAIEDTITLEGKLFRFIDTAGIRQSEDTIETIGVEKTYQAIEKASIVLYVIDASQTPYNEVKDEIMGIYEKVDMTDKHLFIVANKIDLMEVLPSPFIRWSELDIFYLSAKREENIDALTSMLVDTVSTYNNDEILLSNTRHYESLKKVQKSLESIAEAIETSQPSDLIAIDIRNTINHLGEITGEITNDEILGSIFSQFCIGK